MLPFQVIQDLVLALLLGSLIGLQREHARTKDGKPRFAGIRTFMLTSLLGALSAYLSQIFSPYLFLVISACYFLFVLCAYYLEASFSKDIGATTELASMVSFFIGALCVWNETYIAVFIAIAVTSILAFKGTLHRFASQVHENEIYSTLKFAILAFVILPLLPNKGYGPYEVFNPFVIMLMIVLISGMSFAAYLLIKSLGPKKGIAATGVLGGFISSTAITTSLSLQSRSSEKIVNPYVFGIVIAGSMMFIRVIFALFVLNRELVAPLLLPLGVMASIGFISALYLWIKKDEAYLMKSQVPFTSPFTLSPALKFGLFFAAILFLSKAAAVMLGDEAIFGLSLLSGLVDVDAIVVSMANLSKTLDITVSAATISILLALFANTFFKSCIAFSMSSKEVARKVSWIFSFMILGGVLSLILLG